MARLANEINLVILPFRNAGWGQGSRYTRYLCTSRLPASWNNLTSTAIPDTSGLSAAFQKSRATVHAGNALSKSNVSEPLCFSIK